MSYLFHWDIIILNVIPEDTDTFLPLWHDMQYSFAAQIRLLHSQAFTNNHFHSFVALESTISQVLRTAGQTNDSSAVQDDEYKVDVSDIPSQTTATTCFRRAVSGDALFCWRHARTHPHTSRRLSRASLPASSLAHSSRSVEVSVACLWAVRWELKRAKEIKLKNDNNLFAL